MCRNGVWRKHHILVGNKCMWLAYVWPLYYNNKPVAAPAGARISVWHHDINRQRQRHNGSSGVI